MGSAKSATWPEHIGWTRHVGGAVQDLQWGPERTGIIAERVQLKTLLGHTIIILKGTKAWATNLGVESSSSFISDVDPVEWCVLLPEGADGKGDGGQTVCNFQESPDRALYILDTSHGGYHFNPDMGTLWGTPGPVPKIEEGPVDFGLTVHNEARIREISPTQIRVEALLNNGTNSIVAGKYVWKLDGNRQISFSGNSRGYKITASGFTECGSADEWDMSPFSLTLSLPRGFASLRLGDQVLARFARLRPGTPVFSFLGFTLD